MTFTDEFSLYRYIPSRCILFVAPFPAVPHHDKALPRHVGRGSLGETNCCQGRSALGTNVVRILRHRKKVLSATGALRLRGSYLTATVLQRSLVYLSSFSKAKLARRIVIYALPVLTTEPNL